ncbi:MAG TPA: aminotransferase class I/II-fold pyridoxal phosphate-dependent enzyme [Lentibacillus sp.]|uniref:aminotransferase class I/II-fold pyridoxal phosphate-dependent enzyme n=1 Tax=Lentibacillus sp. TaxID=1925746 RepID=UPI002B4B35B6|nr:aminotransferase class I/II-fold pyridoxal phosphate-dependent enzyme [Lentibacillus sp.]HLR61167.1 aminotransferase class I/II-fold pyridoxal phosphate-dependent enzyme [Lentibacillus sp.]
MNFNQNSTPLFDALKQFADNQPTSFHVPGHKSGRIFPEQARKYFDPVLPLDLTELSGLDDLHGPGGVIDEAQKLAASYFGAEHTHFLIGGSTAGNLAMILSVCAVGDKIIVQRNSHKSIFNGLELSGARPIFMAPEFDDSVNRYTAPDIETIRMALEQHRDAKAVMLTYPDYFGKTFEIKEIIELIHEYNVPVLIDEAHGVHFSSGRMFPDSVLTFGADAVVQSAHKMAPAMTMGAFLHIQSGRISNSRIHHYLQMIQSSSPSYPIMASLDLVRAFLANLSARDLELIVESARETSEIFDFSDYWDVLPADDPLKITLQVKPGITGGEIAGLFERKGIYPELSTNHQVLFIHGLVPFAAFNQLKKAIIDIGAQLKNKRNHDIINIDNLFTERLTELDLDYSAMHHQQITQVPLQQSAGFISAEAITPYPPGIPFILKGERITCNHIRAMKELTQQGVHLQHLDINDGIKVFPSTSNQ